MKITFALAALTVAASIAAPTANADELAWPADYNAGCDHIRWGFLGSQVRTICDGPRRPDGSWHRGRLITVPAHTKPAKTTCSGTYSVTCTHYESRDVDTKIIEKVYYDVTDETIPPGEPGWLPSGVSIGNA
ncbi:hypothetical protein KIY81_gp56 [Mycobacterium phage Bugsy]|uniref:CDGP domain-containing protein n=1 Tax=Mycobacterium phage Bugsy TaxID=2656567 RepID=A0A649VDY2_9CAUD|nr:hypothetical protein KIY81_gp56 [Mycobacterium phage Bugsy]AYD86311.1 hypothetical protein SEA_FLARE16_36 [Mycobacterium phage Flare16]QGJ90560.1 hypothetical protein SEA_BUGSY_38 [Mycobacterium phage Bugsy]